MNGRYLRDKASQTRRLIAEKHYWLHACVITAVALLLSLFILYDLSSVSVFAPMEKANDYRLTDLYNVVADRRPVEERSQIVVVSVDSCSREQIARVVDAVDFFGPAAVGLDVFFGFPSAADDALIESLQQCSDLVMPCNAVYDRSKERFTRTVVSFPDRLAGMHTGAVNLAVSSVHNTVREFRPFFPVGSDTVNNFSAEIARLAAPEAFRTLKERNNELETIYYPSLQFDVIHASEILADGETLSTAVEERIAGKIVLIGNIYDNSDFHLTPVDSDMPGLLIHARALHTILDGRYVAVSSVRLNWTIAALVCLLFSWMNIVARMRLQNVGNLLMRLLQFAAMYLFFVIGCRRFADHVQYVDFAPSLLMIGLGMLASDLWFGVVGVYRRFFAKNNK